MNEIVTKFLLAGDTFISEAYLRKPEFTYSACGPFTKSKKGMYIFKETGDSRYIHQKILTCFQHDMAHEGFKDLPKKRASDKVLSNKAFNIAKSPKNDGLRMF